MTRGHKNSQPYQTSELVLRISRSEASSKITERIEIGKKLCPHQIHSKDQLETTRKDYYKWDAYNTELLKRLFSNESLADEYAQFFGVAICGDTSLSNELRDLHEDIQDKIHRLDSIKERLELIPDTSPICSTQTSDSKSGRPTIGGKVFVVHGHDEGARESVARYFEKLGIEPIILHEQASGGRTIIEKLEHHSDVDFAVVLLTPDDVGGTVSAQQQLAPRARQNVVLELGYFVAKIGRSRVCALHKGSVELPSDLLGVVYVPLDAGGAWRVLLAKELRTAGFTVDFNHAI